MKEALVRLELRIVLSYRDQPAERASQSSVRGRHLLRIAGLDSPRYACSRLRYLSENRFLVLRVSLDRVHQIRHKVRAALQLHRDLLLRLLRILIVPLDLIVSATSQKSEKRKNP